MSMSRRRSVFIDDEAGVSSKRSKNDDSSDERSDSYFPEEEEQQQRRAPAKKRAKRAPRVDDDDVEENPDADGYDTADDDPDAEEESEFGDSDTYDEKAAADDSEEDDDDDDDDDDSEDDYDDDDGSDGSDASALDADEVAELKRMAARQNAIDEGYTRARNASNQVFANANNDKLSRVPGDYSKALELAMQEVGSAMQSMHAIMQHTVLALAKGPDVEACIFGNVVTAPPEKIRTFFVALDDRVQPPELEETRPDGTPVPPLPPMLSFVHPSSILGVFLRRYNKADDCDRITEAIDAHLAAYAIPPPPLPTRAERAVQKRPRGRPASPASRSRKYAEERWKWSRHGSALIHFVNSRVVDGADADPRLRAITLRSYLVRISLRSHSEYCAVQQRNIALYIYRPKSARGGGRAAAAIACEVIKANAPNKKKQPATPSESRRTSSVIDVGDVASDIPDITFEGMFVRGMRNLVNALAGKRAADIDAEAQRVQIVTDASMLDSMRARATPDEQLPVLAPIVGGVLAAQALKGGGGITSNVEQFLDNTTTDEMRKYLRNMAEYLLARASVQPVRPSGTDDIAPVVVKGAGAPVKAYAVGAGAAFGDTLRMRINPITKGENAMSNTVFPSVAISTLGGFASAVDPADLAFLVPDEFGELMTAYAKNVALIAQLRAQIDETTAAAEAAQRELEETRAELEKTRQIVQAAQEAQEAVRPRKKRETMSTAVEPQPERDPERVLLPPTPESAAPAYVPDPMEHMTTTSTRIVDPFD